MHWALTENLCELWTDEDLLVADGEGEVEWKTMKGKVCGVLLVMKLCDEVCCVLRWCDAGLGEQCMPPEATEYEEDGLLPLLQL